MTDVVALLKSTEVANTVEVQGKGYSLELTLPENFEDSWQMMEQCRRQTTAAALQQASSEVRVRVRVRVRARARIRVRVVRSRVSVSVSVSVRVVRSRVRVRVRVKGRVTSRGRGG